MASTGIEETADETRLRRAACLLADIGWRAHPDYRGEQSFNIIANAAFVGIDHTARAFLALAVYFRHAGLSEDGLSPQLRELASPQALDHARILGASLRVAYLVSAAMPDVLPRAPLEVVQGKLVLQARRRARRPRRRAADGPAAHARQADRPRAGDRDGVGYSLPSIM